MYVLLHKYNKSNPQGFSLVETLVAISILLLVVVGPLTISARAAKSNSFAAEQAVAHFLAQEGLELAQKARDDIMLAGIQTPANTSWADFINTSGVYQHCFSTAGCGLEMNQVTPQNAVVATPVRCDPIEDCKLHRSLTTTERSRFTHDASGATSTPYTRVIKFFPITIAGQVSQLRVESVVTWRTGNLIANQRMEVETVLFDIYGL